MLGKELGWCQEGRTVERPAHTPPQDWVNAVTMGESSKQQGRHFQVCKQQHWWSSFSREGFQTTKCGQPKAAGKSIFRHTANGRAALMQTTEELSYVRFIGVLNFAQVIYSSGALSSCLNQLLTMHRVWRHRPFLSDHHKLTATLEARKARGLHCKPTWRGRGQGGGVHWGGTGACRGRESSSSGSLTCHILSPLFKTSLPLFSP